MIHAHRYSRHLAALTLLCLLLPATACTSSDGGVTTAVSPSRQGPGLRARLEADSSKRSNAAEARSRLTFSPLLPATAGGHGLVGIYTSADADDIPGGQDLKGKDNVLRVLYEDDLLITEKQWDPSVVPDEASYGEGLVKGVPRTDEYIRTATYKGHTLWLTDAVTLPESTDEGGNFLPGVMIEVSQVSWFSNGITYIVGSPTMKADDLLPIAKDMLK